MKITIDIPTERIADLITTAIESGDPVTTASRGGWCTGIYYKRKEEEPPPENESGPWYTQVKVYESPDFQISIHEIVDEEKFDPGVSDDINRMMGALKIHEVRQEHLVNGLEVMAEKHGEDFGQILDDNIDAPCADIFLQTILFGEEKYA